MLTVPDHVKYKNGTGIDWPPKFGYQNIQVYSFPQMWSNTACGFGGIAGQAFTEAQTTVIYAKNRKWALVFHDDRFAYIVDSPTNEFMLEIRNFRLVGAADYKGQYGKV